MFALLKLKVSGFRMLSNDFTTDFVTRARVNCNEESSEVIKIDNNLYTYSIIAFTGSNSSGKSTTLDLIKNTLILMKTGRWVYRSSDFNSSDIKIHIEFYLDGDIYIYMMLSFYLLMNYLKDKLFLHFVKLLTKL